MLWFVLIEDFIKILDEINEEIWNASRKVNFNI